MKASWAGPLFAAALPFATALPAFADQPVSYQALLTPLLKAGTDIVGQPLAYPDGAPVITAVSMIAVYMGGGGKADAKPAAAPQ